ncbi:MAG TPA: NUDIX domain-containing protein [Candidatus Babeliales bacterium]|nr:NUDIX domain-containing protein [Candidatus Babeliales bacterium]
MPHIHEQYDFAVNTFIVFEKKILLVNHPRYGFWLAPGGHIELNEDPDQALFREIKEETGFTSEDIEVLSRKPNQVSKSQKFLYTPDYVNVHDANAPHKHITLMYFIRAKHDKHVKSDEHTEARWFSVNDLDDSVYNILPDVKFAAKEAIKAANEKI